MITIDTSMNSGTKNNAYTTWVTRAEHLEKGKSTSNTRPPNTLIEVYKNNTTLTSTSYEEQARIGMPTLRRIGQLLYAEAWLQRWNLKFLLNQ